MSTADTIHELAMPVVMISANGLICLALYNRLAAITTRLRSFCHEEFEVRTRLSELRSERDAELAAHFQIRLASVEHQCEWILKRALQIRNALLMLLSAVVGMLVTTLLLGLARWAPDLAGLALATFIGSVLLMIGGIGLAMHELLVFLAPVREEAVEAGRLPSLVTAANPPPLRRDWRQIVLH